MAFPSFESDESTLFSLLEDAIDFAIYRIIVSPEHPYGGKVVMVSPSIKDIAGIEDFWRFETWFTHVHPDDLPRVLESNRRSWVEGMKYDEAVRFYHKARKQWVWIRTISTPNFDSNGKLTHFTGIVFDITKQKQAETELNYRAAFENMILSLATRFINLPPGEIDSAISIALQSIGEFTGVDRSYLFTYAEDRQWFSCTHEWCASEISPQIHRLKKIPVEALAWSNKKLLNGEILHIPFVGSLPEEAQNEKDEFQLQGIQSLLAVPMIYQGNVIGMLGFDAVRSEKSWSEDSVSLLQVAGSIFINALENQRAQMALKQAHEELEQRVVERTQELERTNKTLQIEIEQRKRAEESLQISQALYSEVFDNSPLQIFVQEVLPDGRFRVLRTNPAHQRESGLPPEKIWGKTVEELVIPDVARAINQHYHDCMQAGQPIEYEEQGPSPYWDVERIRTFRTTIAPVYNQQGNVIRLIGSSQDITDQKQAAEIIMQQMREEAVAAERNRLARELHDAVTQTLFTTTLTAEILPKIWAKNPQEGQKKLAELRDLTRGALAEMRTLLVELRPEALAKAELKDLLGHLTSAFVARARIPIEVTVEECGELPPGIKIAFYRVAQEALNNIAKHSDARQVTLSFTCRDGIFELFVEDDGQGFDPGLYVGSNHFGLSIMQERAEQIGARVEIDSRIGEGTQVKMLWDQESSEPLEEEGKGA
jgi:PAS domain S-box-containing protein